MYCVPAGLKRKIIAGLCKPYKVEFGQADMKWSSGEKLLQKGKLDINPPEDWTEEGYWPAFRAADHKLRCQKDAQMERFRVVAGFTYGIHNFLLLKQACSHLTLPRVSPVDYGLFLPNALFSYSQIPGNAQM